MAKRSYLLSAIFVAAVLLSGCAGGISTDTSVDRTATDDLLTVELPLPDSVNLQTKRDEVSARSYDTITMGRIAQGDMVEGRLWVANVSDKPLVIVGVITGCGCTTADYDPKPIPAGDTVTVTWRFDSRGRFGQQFKSIEIVTADRQCATVYLEGEVHLSDRG